MLVMLATMLDSSFATASSLEKWLIMPGPVASPHADIEDDCGACHDPLSDRPQFQMCVACHEDVGRDLTSDTGFHGLMPRSDAHQCSDCHTDHEGRDVDIAEFDPAGFDHALTNFELRGRHVDVECSDCHDADRWHREAPTTCAGCHRADDPHQGRLGDDCGSCHVDRSWTETSFDHDLTTFPLTGSHANATCGACHKTPVFSDVGRTCLACHRDDDVHKGRNGPQCADCHSTDTWETLTFNHLLLTGFPLAGGHGGLACADCHEADDFRDRGGADCVACHRGDDVHEGSNGNQCGDCHDIVDWRAVMFNHTTRTTFPLPPGHDELACSACHTEDIHDALPRDCAGCHEDVHRGQLGSQCDSCHISTHWTQKTWFDHDITRFPLIGAHADVMCSSCHADAAFHDAPEECSACHAKDDPHGGAFGADCGSCHNPTRWTSWRFDHMQSTGFALDGAHDGLACVDCHASETMRLSDDCSSCHRRDDPHSGRFGSNCGSCHSTSSFSDLESM